MTSGSTAPLDSNLPANDFEKPTRSRVNLKLETGLETRNLKPETAFTVELRSIRKTYDHFVAVDHLSLSIREGGVYGLLGPNGAGKTSTIRMMIGITMPDDGEVGLFGEKFHRAQLERVGYLPEERGLYKRMKVIDHLIFLGRLHGLPAADSRQHAVQWCERMQISDWMQK